MHEEWSETMVYYNCGCCPDVLFFHRWTFMHTDYFPKHRALQDGGSNWSYFRTLLDQQVLFLIYLSADDIGNLGKWRAWYFSTHCCRIKMI